MHVQAGRQDRLVIGSVAVHRSTGHLDYRKITDIEVRQALAWAYPYAGRLRGRLV